MLWLEKMASMDASATPDISVMVPIMSGDTSASMSKRISCQSRVLKAFVVWDLCLGPQPMWRNVRCDTDFVFSIAQIFVFIT